MAYSHEYYQQNKAEFRGWARAYEARHRDCVNAAKRRRYRGNHAGYLATKQAWAATHPRYFAGRQQEWKAANPERTAETLRRYKERCVNNPAVRARHLKSFENFHRRLRKRVLEMYGGRCACCGVSDWEFLAIDHVNGGGRKHLLTFDNRLHRYYKWLLEERREGFQVLCQNCNFAKVYGTCPHKR